MVPGSPAARAGLLVGRPHLSSGRPRFCRRSRICPTSQDSLGFGTIIDRARRSFAHLNNSFPTSRAAQTCGLAGFRGVLLMSNIAIALRDEIRRLARKEIRAMVGTTQKAVAQYRREIANLKRLLNKQEKSMNQLKRAALGAAGTARRRRKTAGGCSLFGSIRSGTTAAAGIVGRRLWTPGRRLGADDLQLGVGQVAPATSPIRRLGCRSRNWKARGRRAPRLTRRHGCRDSLAEGRSGHRLGASSEIRVAM